jgi:hypothetical protein
MDLAALHRLVGGLVPVRCNKNGIENSIMKLVIKNLLIAGILLITALGFEICDVKYFAIGQKVFNVVFAIIFLVSFFCFFMINKGIFANIKNNPLRMLSIIVLCGIITLIVWFVVVVIDVNFRIKIGGGV